MWLALALSVLALILLLALVLLTLLALCPVVRRALEARLSGAARLPGPKGRLLFGSALDVDRRRPYFTFTQWSKVFGDAYAFNMFSQKVVVLSSLATIREATSERGHVGFT